MKELQEFASLIEVHDIAGISAALPQMHRNERT